MPRSMLELACVLLCNGDQVLEIAGHVIPNFDQSLNIDYAGTPALLRGGDRIRRHWGVHHLMNRADSRRHASLAFTLFIAPEATMLNKVSF